MNRLHARRAAYAQPATGFVYQPEPRSIGLFARGKQLIAGNFLFGGQLIEAPGLRLWDLTMPGADFTAEVQGFGWLDDLAAVGDGAARTRAQDWTWDWIARYGKGRGPGWTPDLTGRRLIRWINHALLLLSGKGREPSLAFYHSLSHQTLFLSRRWQAASPGLPRIEALTGLIYAGLALTGMEAHVGPAAAALARDCDAEVDAEGGIPTRNPEELLEVFTLLTWAAQALTEAGQQVLPAHLAAMARIAPTLRALRHADGGLARFHGGGRGMEGRLDQALANAPGRTMRQDGLAMGFARLAGGRSTVIVDAAPPPGGRAGAQAHASTLAFELTSGRRPLVVSCGAGAPFGADWQRASRATASHSTLAVEGYSSSRLGAWKAEALADRAGVVILRHEAGPEGSLLEAEQDGWVATHGLWHRRELALDPAGRRLVGADALFADTPAEQKRFDLAAKLKGVGYALRFHLHPDADAVLDMGGAAVSMALKSGEIWVFRHDGQAKLTLEPSVYLQKGRLKPRATKQIVLAGSLQDFQVRIGWTLAKAQDTPLAIRDLDRDDTSSRP
ncbi:heparinase II/III family protein [Rhodobacter ferrooxidans]|uniref:Heparinase II/III family protein n=1 Tax=Rhodobacter ferrooxidans TaxID=371731 RepID=C8RXG3_9RHOB|nr:heparinase II/III family protein [Rhodobacter sp. SW2]EEW26688.1 Heparinase II/III family protein [Rhodobacter sp. SW2]